MDELDIKINSRSFLPYFCKINMLFMLVLTAELLAFVLALASAQGGQQFWSSLGLYSLFILWAVLLSAAMLCQLSHFLGKLTDIQAGFSAFFLIQLVVVLLTALVRQFFPDLSGNGSLFDYIRNSGISCIVSAVLLRYLYMQAQWVKQVEAEHEARLDALQARMRPHFLFNSLNTIASLIKGRPAVAEELVHDLAELFRASLKRDGKMVELSDELELCEQYLNIEKQRLGERLVVKWEIDSLPKTVLIPPLTLQPLLENAIYHGIEKSDLGGELEVLGQIQKGKVILIVRNSAPDKVAEALREGNQMAMDNLRARLKGCFDGQGQVFISRVDGFYQVRLVFPTRGGQ
jgi:two-component system sensor histidine kinase AlgZ